MSETYKQRLINQEIAWKSAATVAMQYQAEFCYCDFCKTKQFASFCRVFHTLNPKVKLFVRKFEILKKGQSEMTISKSDHIFICSSCKTRIPLMYWFPCNCKITEQEILKEKRGGYVLC